MKIIKRSGTEVTFDIDKIMAAVSKANNEVVHSERLSDEQIEMISKNVEDICQEMNRSLSVEEIQDLVENQIMNLRAFAVARKYITYRYKRALVRKSNSTDEQILSLLECNNEEVKDIANQRRILKIIPPENKDDYTRYYLDSLRKERKIEVFVLKYYLKEKLKIDFLPRTEVSTV